MSTTDSFSTPLQDNKQKVNIQLQLLTWDEDGVYFVYAPAFDLTGYGTTLAEAKQSFSTTMKETLLFLENKSTLFDELERLGWMINRKLKECSLLMRKH